MTDYIIVNTSVLPIWVMSAWLALSLFGMALGKILEQETR